MDQFTRRIIGFGVRSSIVDGVGLCRMFQRAIRGHDLDEAKALEARKRAEEARRNATSKEAIAVVEGELAMLAAQLAAIRRLRKK